MAGDFCFFLAKECGIVKIVKIVNEYNIISHPCYGGVIDFRKMLLCASQIKIQQIYIFYKAKSDQRSLKYSIKMRTLKNVENCYRCSQTKMINYKFQELFITFTPA